MVLEAIVGHMLAIVLFAVLPLLSLAFAVLVLAKSPRSLGVRIVVAAAAVAIGLAPTVLLIVLAWSLPTFGN